MKSRDLGAFEAENPLGASSQTMGRSFAIRDMVTVLMA